MKELKRKDVVIIHFNTPKLTEACIRSLFKHTPDCKVILFDNSDSRPFTAGMDNVEVIDNTKGQLINFDIWLQQFHDREPSPGNNYGSAKHCYSIQWIIDHRKTPFVLMDSDVMIRKDISPLWDDSQAFVGHIACNTLKYGVFVQRVMPWLCYINVRMMRKENLSYFNEDKMWNLVSYLPNSKYDTGAWFLEQCRDKNLPFRETDIQSYGIHLRHGSWRDKDIMEFINENKKLWK